MFHLKMPFYRVYVDLFPFLTKDAYGSNVPGESSFNQFMPTLASYNKQKKKLTYQDIPYKAFCSKQFVVLRVLIGLDL